jgi:hypothetical protein
MFIWLRSWNDKNLKLQCSVLTDECAWSFILISHKFPGEVKRINWKPINMSLPSDLNGSSSRIQSLVTMDSCCIGMKWLNQVIYCQKFYCSLCECFVQAFDQENISVRPTQSRWPSWTRLSRSLDMIGRLFWTFGFTDMIEIIMKVVKSWDHWSYVFSMYKFDPLFELIPCQGFNPRGDCFLGALQQSIAVGIIYLPE